MTIVVVRTIAAASVGALIGSAGAFAWLRASSQPVDLEFAAGTAILAVFAAWLGAVVPAISAARQDAVRVLRTP